MTALVAPDMRGALPPARRARADSLVWLGLSAAAHAGAVALVLGLPGRPPGNVEAQVLSVEIVTEAPAIASAASAAGGEPAPQAVEAPDLPPEPAPAMDAPALTARTDARPSRAQPVRPEAMAALDTAPRHADPAPAPEAAGWQMAALSMPALHPDRPAAPRTDAGRSAQHFGAPALAARDAPAPFEPPSRALTEAIRPAPRPDPAEAPQFSRRADSAAAPSAPAQASRAAASAGDTARYAQRLLAHVERHKRYPLAASRAHLGGAARLAITIDGNGGLIGARLLSATGHAVLDAEALAVAKRAAPYPLPEGGIGGPDFSFAVTLRFGR